DFVMVPVGDLWGIDGDVCIALHGRRDDAPGLARADDEVVVGVVVAAGDAVFLVVGVTDGVLVVDLVTAAGKDAALVHFDDVAGPFQHPFDPAVATRYAFLVVNGGDDDLLAAHGAGPLQGPNFQAHGVGVEIAEIAESGRFGVGADDVAGRQQ